MILFFPLQLELVSALQISFTSPIDLSPPDNSQPFVLAAMAKKAKHAVPRKTAGESVSGDVAHRTPRLSPSSNDTCLYHHYGVLASLFLAFGLRRRLPAWTSRAIPAFAFWIPSIQFALFQFSSTLGPHYGPLLTELLTYYPLLTLSMYKAFQLCNHLLAGPATSSVLSETTPALSIFLLFTILQRSTQSWIQRYIGVKILFTRVFLQLALATLYAMVLPKSLLWPAMPSIAFTLVANPHTALQRTTEVLNNTLGLHSYTLLDRHESLTGYISVLESNAGHFRALRCDHSLLGGNWLLPPRLTGTRHAPRVLPEPIYAVFTMLEAVRLIQPSPSAPLSQQKALNIGLGIGTAPSALIHHGINTTIIELDPWVHRYAVEYFSLPHNHSIYLGDAVAAVKANVNKNQTKIFTHVIHDVFTGGAEPIQLFTLEFLSGLRDLMTDDGVVAINYAGDLALPTTSMVFRTITSVFGSCRIFREEPKPESADAASTSAKAGMDFTNMVFFCIKPSAVPIAFRQPIESDFLGSGARLQFLVPKFEVMHSEFERDGDLLTENNVKVVEKWQAQSAVGHWRVMRNVLPDVVWEYCPDHETVLLDITIDALRDFKEQVKDNHNGTIDLIIGMITSMKVVNGTLDSRGTVNELELSNALRDLPEKGGTILLHIRAQNAGVMISKVDCFIHVEAFELCPINEQVLTTKGRLLRSFPGPALGLTIDAFEQPDLQATIAHTLAKMSHQPALETQPQVRKAGRMHDESRDTTHPKMDEIPSDLLYTMNAKLGRRLVKLDPLVPKAGIALVQRVMRTASEIIRVRWERIMRRASPRHDLSILESLDFKRDAFAHLKGLSECINSLSTGANWTATDAFRPTSVLVKYQAGTLPTSPFSSDEYLDYNLKAFEAWVASHLPQWLEHHKGNASTCGELSALMVTYYQVASARYSGNPESFSTLLLTIIELWIACDQSALHLCKFLEEYDPGIPPEAYGATNDAQRAELLAHAVELALICTDTFNVDDSYLGRILTLHEDGSVFIQCCILIQNSASANVATSQPMTSILHQRWKSLCYRSYTILANQIVNVDSRSLDDAIRNTWSSYAAGDGWRAVSNEFDHWLFKTLSLECSEKPLVVHYNLLTGELLVGGLPLAHLPSNYVKHLTYRTLFGQSSLEVMPTTVKGMQFSAKRDHAGYTIYLGIRPISDTIDLTGSDFLVRAVKDGRTYDLVPSRVLRGHFPGYFTEKFVHWYNEKDDCVEFRSIKDPWNSYPDNWKLIRDPCDDRWRLTRDGLFLISVESETARVISGILSPLENSSRLHITLQSSSSSLEIELPRLSLAFFLKSGTSLLRSKQFRALSIDSDQSFGTLVGLQSKLMLQDDATGRRSVIIPEGCVSYRRDGDHVHVTIAQDSSAKAHAYPVDYQLGRLLDNGTLQSKLWICYLHALTSFCLPDPLMQRTGTEQALFILGSAAVRSFDRLAQENIDVLRKIARLTAGRSYYPANERVMQTVKWAPELSFLAQHGGFYKLVKLIFAQAERTRVFYLGSHIRPPTLDHVEPDLLDRDCIRSSTFRVSGFGAEDHTVECDAIYSARDEGQNSPEGFKAFVMSNFSNQDYTLDQLVKALETQWPCESPTLPEDTQFCTYMDMNKVKQATRLKFKTCSSFEKGYVEDLRVSLQSFQSWEKQYRLALEGKSKSVLYNHLSRCKDHVDRIYTTISDAAAGCTGEMSSERLISLLDSQVDLIKELRNPGHTNWDPFVHPESLLLEVESGFLIRDVQEEIARQMRDVVENATMQLNMGEGKSSVIVPAVAAALADGSRLVRVVTAKPQAKQMFQMLVSKLGGLLNRRVCHMPFSRSLQLKEADAVMIGEMCREIMINGDILLVQPEHVLSFKLMGIECLLTGRDKIGRSLLLTQDFFDTSSRDIVDESDENFNVKFELIYTMGMQRPVEFSPRRWVYIQQVLDIVRDLAPEVKLELPFSMEVGEEFSHPDVIIVLTCLCYYYGGMKNDDLFLAFDHLHKSDQADVEYQEWVKDAPELPAAFRQLSGINLKDRVQCIRGVFPWLRFAKKAIDYFLTHLVFPKEMREFPHKLSTSGWDIGQIKTLPTSGFSGTNDSRMTLPLSVRQLDLQEQKHTNALVLEHLLRPENSVMVMPTRAEDVSSTAESLLDMVTEMDPPAQVVLDVGAQILELSNVEVAREWLKRTQDREEAQAVVFFNEDDELSVLDRRGRIERLQTSPFADQLDAEQNVNLQHIANRCLEFDSLEHGTASLQEEQERELSPEIVQEREVQRPAPAAPAKHRIHPDLRAFVIDGILRKESAAFKPAFETLRQTSAAAYIDVSQFPPDVLVTVDFASTVQSSGRCALLDTYQRSVQWILTSVGSGSDNVVKYLVIISPYEAEMLLTDAKYVPSSGTYPSGFYVSGVHVGVKASNSTKPDLAFITSDRPAHAAAVFTTNKFQAAPVQVSRSVLEGRKGEGVRSIIINSGCANAVTGEGGLQDAEAMARAATACFDNSPLSKTATPQSLVMSTGVIGQRLPIDKIVSGIPRAYAELGASHDSWLRTAKAIMTTDTFPKLVSTTFTLPSTKGTEYRLAGMTKGAGMIHPNMATLLGIMATDAPITAPALHSLLTTANARSFNSISIDGDTSTNDTVAILANGAGAPENGQYITSAASPDYAAMSELLTSFAQRLAHLVVRDGEGATKFVEIRVRNAASNAAAQLVAASIARSPLVKTALYGRDANWGRILCAIGYTAGVGDEVVVPTRTSVSFIPADNSGSKDEGVLRLLVNGEPQAVDEARAARLLEDEDLIVDVDLGTGVELGQYWTCDFSHEYVTINGDYRT
ncbi:hypothetical protein DV737_g5547, partial [Chaetothyriales sp. CBS 132003]